MFGDETEPAVLQEAITTIILRSVNHREIIDRLENEIIYVLNRVLGQ